MNDVKVNHRLIFSDVLFVGFAVLGVEHPRWEILKLISHLLKIFFKSHTQCKFPKQK